MQNNKIQRKSENKKRKQEIQGIGTQTRNGNVVVSYTIGTKTEQKMPNIEVGTQTETSMSTTRGIQTEPITLYNPLIVDATIQVLNKKTEEHQETITQYQREVVAQREDTELLQKFKVLTIVGNGIPRGQFWGKRPCFESNFAIKL